MASVMVFEIWDKNVQQTAGKVVDDLLGLVKVSLRPFYSSLKSELIPETFTAHHILTNAYPFIIADEYKPIINPRLGEQVGSIKLSLAVGTPPQIQRYEFRDQQSKHPIFSDDHMDTERGLDTLERENIKNKEEESNRQILSPKSGTHTEENKEDQIKGIEHSKIKQEEISPKPTPLKPEVSPEKDINQESKQRSSIEEIDEITKLLNQPKNSETEQPEKHDDLVKIFDENQDSKQEQPEESPEKPKMQSTQTQYTPPSEEDIPQPRSPSQVHIESPQKIPDTIISPFKSRPPKYMKHLFNISVTEILNIPILSKYANLYNNKVTNIFIRATLPFDRSPIESERVTAHNSNDYSVSMECSYSLIMEHAEDSAEKIAESMQHQDTLIELCMLDPQMHFPVVLGTAELPSEDLQLLICEGNAFRLVDRVVFLYGSAAADREGLIIGKIKLLLKYDPEPLDEIELVNNIWQQEKVVSREIPVQSRMMVFVHKIDGIEESRPPIATRTFSRSLFTPPQIPSLSVYYCPNGEFIEENEEKKEFVTDTLPEHICPQFNAKWYIDCVVNEKILRNLQHGFATFHIIHTSQSEEGEPQLIGRAKVPLIKVLSSYSGVINEPFEIRDRYNHCYGYLHISMNLLDYAIPIQEVPKPVVRKKSEPLQEEKSSEEEKKISTGSVPHNVFPIAQMEILIESGLRLQNPIDESRPPSTFAVIKSALTEEIFKSEISYKNSYPLWNSSHLIVFPLSPENIERLQKEQLYIYVYHRETMLDNQDLLLGMCGVDVSILASIDNMNLVEGYYKLSRDYQQDEDLKDEKGIIKLRIETPQNIKQLITGEEKPLEPLLQSPRFGGEEYSLERVYETLKEIHPEEKEVNPYFLEENKGDPRDLIYSQSLERISEEMSANESEGLLQKHLKNLNELEEMTEKYQAIWNSKTVLPHSSEGKPQLMFTSTTPVEIPREEQKYSPSKIEPEPMHSKTINDLPLSPPRESLPSKYQTLLSTPSKKPNLPAYSEISPSKSPADINEKELLRIANIIRNSPGSNKKYYQFFKHIRILQLCSFSSRLKIQSFKSNENYSITKQRKIYFLQDKIKWGQLQFIGKSNLFVMN